MKSSCKRIHARRIAVYCSSLKCISILIIVIANLVCPKYLVNAQSISGSSYYVSLTGSDNNPGTYALPWRTFTYAETKIHAGDSLFIRGGTYQERIYITDSGTETNPIRITNYSDEEVIIDGANLTIPPLGSSASLVGINGDWVTVTNLTIRSSGGFGVVAHGAHVILENLYVHHNWASGILLTGNYDIVLNSRIWYNSMMNENGQSSLNGSGVSCARYPDYCTIRHNTVWGNWGEGISTFEALHTTIEDNVSYDNQINIYVSDTKYTTTQRNLTYCTPGNPIGSYTYQFGIAVWDEKGVPIPLDSDGTRYHSSDNIIQNNLGIGCSRNLGLAADANNNNFYAYNTFVDAAGTSPTNVFIYTGDATNTRFVNNLILQEDDNNNVVWWGTGITFENNLWSKPPYPSPNASGPGDTIGDPKLAKTGSLAAGQLTADYFKLLSDSPAIDKAVALSQVTDDYFANSRGTHPDIGAAEYTGTVPSPTSTTTSTPTSTSTPLPPTETPTQTSTSTPPVETPTLTPPTIVPTSTEETATPTLSPTPEKNKDTKLAHSPWPKGRGKPSNQALSSFTGPSETTLLWSYTNGSTTGSSPVLGSDGTLYSGLGFSIVALSSSGDELWSFPTGGVVTSPLLTSDGNLYFGSADRNFYSISAVDGSLNWSYKTNAAIQAAPNIATDGTLYIPSTDGILYAFDPYGTFLWSFTSGSTIRSSTAVSEDGSICFGASNGKLYYLDPVGVLQWSYQTNGPILSSPAIGSDGTIYTGADRYLYAIDSSGSLKWSYRTRGTISSPAIALDGTIYAGSADKKLYAFSPSGTLLWSYLLGGTVNAPVISLDETIYIGSNDGYLTAVTRDGSLVWQYYLGGNVSIDPVLDTSGNIVIGSSGSIYSVGVPSSPVTSPWQIFLPGIYQSGG